MPQKHQITIKYYCTETEQIFNININYTRENNRADVEINMDFVPDASDDTIDPMQVITKLINMLKDHE